jgi:hypothetical protein
MGGAGTFGFYTGTNLLAFFFTFLFMRETKQLSLEELDQVSSHTPYELMSRSFRSLRAHSLVIKPRHGFRGS